MSFWFYFILFFFPLLGGTIGLIIKTENTQYLKLFLAFSGAFLFSITAINLIPEVYSAPTDYPVGYFILAGFLLQILIDVFSHGVEHGHLHHHHTHETPYGIFIALSLHAFLEGMAAGSDLFSERVHASFVFGIALHEIPAAFALITILRASGVRKKYLYTWLVVYALMTVMGALLSEFALNLFENMEHYMVYLVALVIGVFLHISTTILFENTDDHKFGRRKLLAIGTGVGIALLSTLVH
ncbi:MAG: ZIP family metal transporter [Flavobacteriales bacterium]|nr:ZIP family metal transporter [Bacteroidota bacterium]MCB9241725.1 ZIP family metal transporter [Flavobacteriales bacterium]